MKFKPGDKVSFLNEKRDGIVKKVLNNKMVIVEIEEGFEIPVIESDLVKSNPFEDENLPAIQKPFVNSESAEPENEERFPERFAIDNSGSDDKKLKSGFYIAFIPENEQQFLESSFAVYFLNNTSSDALFTYSLMENGKYICADFDRIDESTALLLTDIDKSGFDKWEYLQFQFVFFKKGYESAKSPQTIELRIKPLHFYKEDNYTFLSAIGEKCFLIPFSEKEKQEPEEWKEEQWKNEKVPKLPGLKIVGHINDLQKPATFPEKHLLENGIAEVDLHIEELVDDLSKYKNHEMLSVQLNYFVKMLDSAITNKIKKIIFIHGVGNGLLKQEIISRLINNYPDLIYADASLLRYGKGATEIIIRERV